MADAEAQKAPPACACEAHTKTPRQATLFWLSPKGYVPICVRCRYTRLGQTVTCGCQMPKPVLKGICPDCGTLILFGPPNLTNGLTMGACLCPGVIWQKRVNRKIGG